MSEDDKEYRFAVELTGVPKKGVDVPLADNVLAIQGEKKAEGMKEENGKVIRMERCFGNFRRSFALPTDVDAIKVDATFDKCVLIITVAKR